MIHAIFTYRGKLKVDTREVGNNLKDINLGKMKPTFVHVYGELEGTTRAKVKTWLKKVNKVVADDAIVELSTDVIKLLKEKDDTTRKTESTTEPISE